MLLLIAIGGAAFGGAAAALVVAPRLIARQSTAAADSTRKGESPDAGDEQGAEGGEMKESKIVSFDNLIVNPAGSQGTRFLMTSVALEVDGAATEKKLRDHELEIRDLVTSILESQSLQTLTAPGARDSVKNRVSAAVQPFMGKGARLRVYLPQFVIQ